MFSAAKEWFEQLPTQSAASAFAPNSLPSDLPRSPVLPPPPAKLIWDLRSGIIPLFCVDVRVLAVHMTLYDYMLLQRVHACELVQKGFEKPGRSPVLHQLVGHFNQVAAWAIHAIINERRPHRRATVLGRELYLYDPF